MASDRSHLLSTLGPPQWRKPGSGVGAAVRGVLSAVAAASGAAVGFPFLGIPPVVPYGSGRPERQVERACGVIGPQAGFSLRAQEARRAFESSYGNAPWFRGTSLLRNGLGEEMVSVCVDRRAWMPVIHNRRVTSNLFGIRVVFRPVTEGAVVGQTDPTASPFTEEDAERYRKQIEEAEKTYQEAKAAIEKARGKPGAGSPAPACTTAVCQDLQAQFRDAAARAEAIKNAETAKANAEASKLIGGAAGAVSFAAGPALGAFVLVAGGAAYEAQKWLFGAIFGGGPDYFSDEAKASAARNFDKVAAWGFPPPLFAPGEDVNPLDYDERQLQTQINLVNHRYEGYLMTPAQQSAFFDAGKSIAAQIASDPAIQKHFIDIAGSTLAKADASPTTSVTRNWMDAGPTTQNDVYGRTGRALVEMIALAAARQNNVPFVGYGPVIVAAEDAWNKAFSEYGSIQVQRQAIYPTRVCGDSCEGLIEKPPVVEAISEAWIAANLASRGTTAELRSLGVTLPRSLSSSPMAPQAHLPGILGTLGGPRTATRSASSIGGSAKPSKGGSGGGGGIFVVLAAGLGLALLGRR